LENPATSENGVSGSSPCVIADAYAARCLHPASRVRAIHKGRNLRYGVFFFLGQWFDNRHKIGFCAGFLVFVEHIQGSHKITFFHRLISLRILPIAVHKAGNLFVALLLAFLGIRNVVPYVEGMLFRVACLPFSV
jgi:hypothetical protein